MPLRRWIWLGHSLSDHVNTIILSVGNVQRKSSMRKNASLPSLGSSGICKHGLRVCSAWMEFYMGRVVIVEWIYIPIMCTFGYLCPLLSVREEVLRIAVVPVVTLVYIYTLSLTTSTYYVALHNRYCIPYAYIPHNVTMTVFLCIVFIYINCTHSHKPFSKNSVHACYQCRYAP